MAVGNISFKGAVPVESVVPRDWAKQFFRENELKKEMLNHMPDSVKTLDKMKNFVGEVPNIIINALGTGLVAPFFIKYNFLSKTDDDTRTYSAWRQPVSAALAVVTQAGLVGQYNKALDNHTNKGDFVVSKYNKTAYQDVSYLEKVIKKENPSLSKEEVTKLAKARQYTQLEDMIENLYNKGTVEYTSGAKKVALNPEQVKSLLEQTTDDMLAKAKNNPTEKGLITEMKEAIKNNKDSSKIVQELHAISKKIPDCNFVYDVAQKHISNTGSNIKFMKQMSGLAVSLAILPLTCCMLNYLYPKFMKAFFPNLDKSKSKNAEKPQDTFEKAQPPENVSAMNKNQEVHK